MDELAERAERRGAYAYDLLMQGFGELLGKLRRSVDKISGHPEPMEESVYQHMRAAVSAGRVSNRDWFLMIASVARGMGFEEAGEREKWDGLRWLLSPSELVPGAVRRRAPRVGFLHPGALDTWPGTVGEFRAAVIEAAVQAAGGKVRGR